MRRAADLAALFGRVLLGALFLWAGVMKAMAPPATMAVIAKYGITAVHLAYWGAIGIELVVALAFVLGWKTRVAAVILAAWCLATAWVAHFHPANQVELTQFLKNLGLAGGFLQFAVHGAGRFSLDRR